MTALTREMLEAAGFDCVLDVCAECGHHGGDHDLWNRCLLCDCRVFCSMREEAKWAMALAALAAAMGVEE